MMSLPPNISVFPSYPASNTPLNTDIGEGVKFDEVFDILPICQ